MTDRGNVPLVSVLNRISALLRVTAQDARALQDQLSDILARGGVSSNCHAELKSLQLLDRVTQVLDDLSLGAELCSDHADQAPPLAASEINEMKLAHVREALLTGNMDQLHASLIGSSDHTELF